MKDTFIPSKPFLNRKWHIIDADQKLLGRLATKISTILIGKRNLFYTPFLEIGNSVVVINAEKIKVSGKKEKQKIYHNHSGRPGGLRSETFIKLRQRKPEKILEAAVKGMLPKGKLGRKIYTNLRVYQGTAHPHKAQTY
jgi:large subunit ribosomal protein L13